MTNTIKNLGLAATCVAVLAGCATAPEGPRRPVAAAAASRPPAAADRELAAQASAFESFMRKASGIDADFAGPADVSQALQTGAAHEPKELEAGMIAYAAMAALQEPRFVAGVRAERDRGLAGRLAADPRVALELPGGEQAGARASGALYAQGAALSGEGEKVKHAAYTIQHQAWAKTMVADPRGRLSRVKRISAEGYRPSRDDGARLQSALAQGGRRGGGSSSPVVARGVALAALSLLGEDGKARSLMSEPRTSSCLRIAKLNLYQCLASAGPHYEDIYCLGQHAMIDPGQCVVEATRAPPAPRRTMVTRASYRR